MAGDITQRLIGSRGGNQDGLGATLSFQRDPGRIEVFDALARKMWIVEKTRRRVRRPGNGLQPGQVLGLSRPDADTGGRVCTKPGRAKA